MFQYEPNPPLLVPKVDKEESILVVGRGYGVDIIGVIPTVAQLKIAVSNLNIDSY
jgi:hypothetical protein